MAYATFAENLELMQRFMRYGDAIPEPEIRKPIGSNLAHNLQEIQVAVRAETADLRELTEDWKRAAEDLCGMAPKLKAEDYAVALSALQPEGVPTVGECYSASRKAMERGGFSAEWQGVWKSKADDVPVYALIPRNRRRAFIDAMNAIKPCLSADHGPQDVVSLDPVVQRIERNPEPPGKYQESWQATEADMPAIREQEKRSKVGWTFLGTLEEKPPAPHGILTTTPENHRLGCFR